ncbi:hypothetical protein FA15DRAFT_701747 [Coprinopsis marcescibilis]|uniref:Uncharacterized protein n=1 Tax=Coprinopsis marcescibilis TaxID=230819 RepID=A0A5C3L4C4_COPMA|nr:hypothetical protein FA15DRAFT_701747 [Coprinopsis marcescibilis]
MTSAPCSPELSAHAQTPEPAFVSITGPLPHHIRSLSDPIGRGVNRGTPKQDILSDYGLDLQKESSNNQSNSNTSLPDPVPSSSRSSSSGHVLSLSRHKRLAQPMRQFYSQLPGAPALGRQETSRPRSCSALSAARFNSPSPPPPASAGVQAIPLNVGESLTIDRTLSSSSTSPVDSSHDTQLQLFSPPVADSESGSNALWLRNSFTSLANDRGVVVIEEHETCYELGRGVLHVVEMLHRLSQIRERRDHLDSALDQTLNQAIEESVDLDSSYIEEAAMSAAIHHAQRVVSSTSGSGVQENPRLRAQTQRLGQAFAINPTIILNAAPTTYTTPISV